MTAQVDGSAARRLVAFLTWRAKWVLVKRATANVREEQATALLLLELGKEVAIEEVMMVDLDDRAVAVTEVCIELRPHLSLRLVHVRAVAGRRLVVRRAATASLMSRHGLAAVASARVRRLRAESVRGRRSSRILRRELALEVLIARWVVMLILVVLILIGVHNV